MNDAALVKDVWRSWPIRSPVGSRLCARVGARAWKPPRFGPGRTLFGRCGIPDPWDPEVEQVEVGLGDVGLKDDRRQPAPHAAPPPTPGSSGPKLSNVPAAPKPGPVAEANKGRPAPQIGESRRFDPSELKPKTESVTTRPKAPPKRDAVPSAFGGGPVHHAVAKLPMRPGFQPGESPPKPAPVAPAPMKLGTGLGAPAAPRPAGAAASPRADASGGSLGSRAGTPGGPPAIAASAPASGMISPDKTAVSSPASAQPHPPAETRAADSPARPASPPPPVNRRPPSAGGGGLDDLFGMGGGENTRIKLNRGPAEGEAPRPRRPMVSSPEELEKAGLDRRPPPPKAPPPPAGVAPSTKPTAARSDDDLPGE